MEEINDTKKDGRGGKRPGAGRPRTYWKKLNFKAPLEMAEHIESYDNKSEYIKSCVEADMMRQRELQMKAIRSIGKLVNTEGAEDMMLTRFENVKVAAGIPIGGGDAEEYMESIKTLLRMKGTTYTIEVKGDSMIDAHIYSGDLVVIENFDGNYTEKDILFCEVDGEYTIKHVHHRDGKVLLVPDNKNYKVMEVAPEMLKIWGKVTSCIHLF